MGKKDKHKLGQTRNNPVFKVANGRLAKQKGKAQAVTSKLKKISNESKRKAVNDADDQLMKLRNESVSILGKEKPKSTKVEPTNVLKEQPKVDVDSLTDAIEMSMTKEASK